MQKTEFISFLHLVERDNKHLQMYVSCKYEFLDLAGALPPDKYNSYLDFFLQSIVHIYFLK